MLIMIFLWHFRWWKVLTSREHLPETRIGNGNSVTGAADHSSDPLHSCQLSRFNQSYSACIKIPNLTGFNAYSFVGSAVSGSLEGGEEARTLSWVDQSMRHTSSEMRYVTAVTPVLRFQIMDIYEQPIERVGSKTEEGVIVLFCLGLRRF